MPSAQNRGFSAEKRIKEPVKSVNICDAHNDDDDGTMRQTLVRLARPRRPVRNTQPLLPPLALYRRILRAHRLLPPAQQELGNMYVKEEFKAHKSTDNPLYIVGFLTSWQEYLGMVTEGKWIEGSMTTSELNKMSPEQVNQLYELMKETQRYHSGESALPEEDEEKKK
jgi:hypothetical protein